MAFTTTGAADPYVVSSSSPRAKSVYVPFDDEDLPPFAPGMPPQLNSYVTEQQWQTFSETSAAITKRIQQERRAMKYMGVSFGVLGVALLVVSNLSDASMPLVGNSLWSVLGCCLVLLGIFVATPLFYDCYFRPRLWKKMTALCQTTSDGAGVMVQFKKDKGHILSSEPGFSQQVSTTNYYVDVWLVQPLTNIPNV